MTTDPEAIALLKELERHYSTMLEQLDALAAEAQEALRTVEHLMQKLHGSNENATEHPGSTRTLRTKVS